MEYRKRQIQRIIDVSRNGVYRSIKISCADRQTNYLNVTHKELVKIQELLKKDIN